MVLKPETRKHVDRKEIRKDKKKKKKQPTTTTTQIQPVKENKELQSGKQQEIGAAKKPYLIKKATALYSCWLCLSYAGWTLQTRRKRKVGPADKKDSSIQY